MIEDHDHIATYQEAFKEYARNSGMDDQERPWILTPWDTWEANPWYTGPEVEHPEYTYGGDGEDFIGPLQPTLVIDDEIPF